MNTQIPEDLKNRIAQEAEDLYNLLDEKARDYDHYEYGLPMFEKCKQPIIDLLNSYAALLVEEREKAMRWVKAREHVPFNVDLVYIRYSHGFLWRKTTGYYENGQWYQHTSAPFPCTPNIEWLYDPTTPQALKEGGQP